MDYSPVCIRLPAHCLPEHVNALREQFPKIEIQVGGVNRIIVSGDCVSDLMHNVYDWSREHLPAA